MRKFSSSVIEKIQYYVYVLIDPRDKQVFYIGKGRGNRVFSHVNGAIKGDKLSEKINQIHSILSCGLQINHYIVRHGLTEKEALEVEGALIDFYGKSNLTNIALGHNSSDRGIMDINEININYDAQDVEITDKVILININNLYSYGISDEDLYEATRKAWVLNMERANLADYIFCHYHGIIREVYKLSYWQKSDDFRNVDMTGGKIMNRRYEFIGNIDNTGIRRKYLFKSVGEHSKKGSQNPIKYVNC